MRFHRPASASAGGAGPDLGGGQDGPSFLAEPVRSARLGTRADRSLRGAGTELRSQTVPFCAPLGPALRGWGRGDDAVGLTGTCGHRWEDLAERRAHEFAERPAAEPCVWTCLTALVHRPTVASTPRQEPTRRKAGVAKPRVLASSATPAQPASDARRTQDRRAAERWGRRLYCPAVPSGGVA